MELLPDGHTFKVRAGVGWRPGIIGEVTVTAAENSPEWLALKDSAVISIGRDKKERFEYHAFMKEHGFKAFVNVLVPRSKDRPPISVLQVDSRKSRKFTQSDIEFLRSYANLIGATIERLRVVHELRALLNWHSSFQGALSSLGQEEG